MRCGDFLLADLGILVGMEEMLTSASVCSHCSGIQLPQIPSVLLLSRHCPQQDTVVGMQYRERDASSVVLALLLPVMDQETLWYLLLLYTVKPGCLKTMDVVLKSCFGEIPCFKLVKAYCILLDGFLKCGLEQKFKP